MPKTPKKHPKNTQKHIKSVDWDTLAYDIIRLEKQIRKEKKHKQLILLKNKLKTMEEEKKRRIQSFFDMKSFIDKNFQ
jgi:hypothetical protein